jgi:hypothetical protein
MDLDGVTLFVGRGDAVIAFPDPARDLAQAVRLALEVGVREVGCWAAASDATLAARLSALGFQDGWQPHWMGLDPQTRRVEADRFELEETTACDRDLPYCSPRHESVIASGDGIHHFVARETSAIVGHAVLNVDGETGGIYDMGVKPQSRLRDHGLRLGCAAIARAQAVGCTSVTLNATGEGEPLYRSLGFESLGIGMTWWLFPS